LNCSGNETEVKFVFVTGASTEKMRNSENQSQNTPPKCKYPNLLVITREFLEKDFQIPFE